MKINGVYKFVSWSKLKKPNLKILKILIFILQKSLIHKKCLRMFEKWIYVKKIGTKPRYCIDY